MSQLILSNAGGLVSSESLPAHLTEHGAEGTDEVKKYLRPGRIKVIQTNATEQFAAFKPGSVIATPSNVLLAKNDEYFYIVPMLFFMEWYVTNPFQMKNSLPFIRVDKDGNQMRTIDPSSSIAIKSKDDETRTEPCPENSKYDIRYVESINFICWVVKNPQFGQLPALISFSKGEHRRGSQVRDLISLRAQQKIAIYANVLECRVPKEQRHLEQGDWYGIDVSSPTQPNVQPFVMDPGEFAQIRAAHMVLREQWANKLVIVDREDEAEEPEADSRFA